MWAAVRVEQGGGRDVEDSATQGAYARFTRGCSPIHLGVLPGRIVEDIPILERGLVHRQSHATTTGVQSVVGVVNLEGGRE